MQNNISKLKKELDRVFSIYIRTKYSKNGYVKCFTCGAVKEIKQIQNGHFIPRNVLSTRFDEDNCRPQCVGCNMFGGGKIFDFEENLVKELGQKKVDELKQRRHKLVKLEPSWYREKIEHYKLSTVDLTK